MTVPELGFGSAPVLGSVGRRQSLLALDYAYQLGVRHFDCARSYGWGEAESVLNQGLSAYPRVSYRLVSKCGLVPPKRSTLLSLAKQAARGFLKVLPGTHGWVRRVASTKHFRPTTTYDLAALGNSVATSLRELGTDYLDVLLLHNFEVGKPGLLEVVGLFRDLQRQGKIRRYGFSVEGDLNVGLAYLAEHGLLDDVVLQVPVCDALFSLPPQWRHLAFITHSPFRYLANQNRSSLRIQNLGELFKALAEACNCEAVVCSMFDPVHIESNMRAREAVR